MQSAAKKHKTERSAAHVARAWTFHSTSILFIQKVRDFGVFQAAVEDEWSIKCTCHGKSCAPCQAQRGSTFFAHLEPRLQYGVFSIVSEPDDSEMAVGFVLLREPASWSSMARILAPGDPYMVCEEAIGAPGGHRALHRNRFSGHLQAGPVELGEWPDDAFEYVRADSVDGPPGVIEQTSSQILDTMMHESSVERYERFKSDYKRYGDSTRMMVAYPEYYSPVTYIDLLVHSDE